jgi:DNA-binding MarR family transcriptional regulator
MDGNLSEISKEVSKRIARECIAVRVRLLNRVITSLYDDALRPLGLTVSQLNMLIAICRMEQPDAKQVGRALQIDSSTLSRSLNLMRKQGLLRFAKGKDARTKVLRITTRGDRAINAAVPLWEQAQKKALDILGGNLEAVGKIASGIWARSSR